MCTVCGCSGDGATIEGAGKGAHVHVGPDGRTYTHSHDHGEGAHEHEDGLGDGCDHAHPHAHEHEHLHAHPHGHVGPDGQRFIHSHPHAHDHGTDHESPAAHAHAHEHAHAHTHLGPDGQPYSHAHPHAHAPNVAHVAPYAHQHVHAHGHAHGHAHEHVHVGADGAVIRHAHDHRHDPDSAHDDPAAHDHGHDHGRGDLHYGEGPAGASVPGMSQARMIAIETDILAKNDAHARANRARLDAAGILALNLVSSPGSGKTTLLCRTIEALAGRLPVSVIEGDQQTTHDADRIRAAGARALQINTGKGCHLDAKMVGEAIDRLAPEPFSVLFVENVGNLVCPAAFDLGEEAKVAIFSVTEGEDKPLKYPDMFAAASLVVLNKTDLAPHCDADLDAMERNARRVNPAVDVIRLSARTGEGMDAWLDWIAARRRARLDAAAADAETRLSALRAAAAAF